MASFPKKIIYGFRSFTVQLVKSSQIEHRYGEYDQGKIKIASDFSSPDRADTLLHEYMHGVAETLGIFKGLPNESAVEERCVRALSAAISEIIVRNPRVFDWVIENLRRDARG